MGRAVFGWFFKDSRVAAMAKVIHEMSCYAHHLRDLTGAPLHKFFLSHPMLKNHRAPTPRDRDQVHFFLLSDGRRNFQVMVCDGQQDGPAWMSIAPDGEFEGAHVQSGKKGRYSVRVDRPLSRPQGALASAIVSKFVGNYDAMDMSI